MDLWPKNQELLPQYTRFRTVPGRNLTHNYHDRHQAPHYPPGNHKAQQNHVRESGYWTLPRTRTGAMLLDHTNWTEPQVCASTSAQHPFILGHHSQQNMGDNECFEAREWTTAGQVAGAYERDNVREGWQRRWEPSSLVHYRESSKRDSSSYRELEAWAARYSHSLPRRRRLEAELMGSSLGLLESRQTGTESCMATLQQVGQCANTRDDPGQWERAAKQQTHWPPQDPNMSHTVGMKGKIQSKIFSQPPGYVAPPPYNSPNKGSPLMPHCWEQVEKTQEKPDRNQQTPPELEGHGYQGNVIQNVHTPHKVLTCPQMSQEVKTTKIIPESSSKVIEGRKFRLSKKTGGMTIFCLVSRIAGPTEFPSLTPIDQTNIPNTELGKCSPNSSEIVQTSKVADEVDYKALTRLSALTFGDRNLKPKKMTPSCIKSGEEELPKKDKTEGCQFKEKKNDAESTLEKRAAPLVSPVSARYPLWREPSFTKRTRTQSPLGMEVRRLDIKKGPESEEGKDLLVIDTTCVVVKMELIKSPKKEHIHLLRCTTHTEQSPEQSPASSGQTSGLLSLEPHSNQNSDSNLSPRNERSQNRVNPDHAETTTIESETENMARDYLEKGVERTLGIRLNATLLPDVCMKDADKGLDSPQVNKEMKGKLLQETIKERMSDDEDTGPNDDCDTFSGSQHKVSNVFKENETNSQSGLDNVDQFDMTEDPPVGSTPEVANPEQSPIENYATRCVTPPPVLSNPHLLAASEDAQGSNSNLVPLPLAVQSLPCISESETEEAPDVETGALDPFADCTLQLGTASLPHVPSLIPLTEPSTLPLCLDVIPSNAMSDIEVFEGDQAEKQQSSQYGELSDVPNESPNDGTAELVAQEQLECGSANKVVFDIALDLLKQTPGISQEKPPELNTEQQLLSIQTEKENKTDHSEKVTHSQSEEKEVKSLDFQVEEDVKVKETNMESPEDNKDLQALEQQTVECQSDILVDTKSSSSLPSDTNYEAQPHTPSPPQESREEFAPHSETNSAYSSIQNHESPVGLPETLSDVHLLDCTPSENSLLCSPPPEESGSCTPNIAQGAEVQYPNSLWDAVNRIRKHTAPDSENEEEEVFEFWDPECAGVDLEQELTVLEGTEVGQMVPQPWNEEDTLSCSSTSSHDSGDTVIIADEDDVEETEEGGRCCLVEAEQNTAGEEEREGDGDERACDQSEKYQTLDEGVTTKDEETKQCDYSMGKMCTY
ncbi:uncharacterized protein si:ch211-159e12.5 [Phyllopteryx taeniolatus]|uniref:uncharacterized protein si:ch211-159e12.5 n=1 Tax=Phyllopteryx taeniolatus TaxID=161469 RepID=UPI002AD26520|nr:uncharacterized protein si:ch211-159e12.5 [Phyllopteryx taeniolatus]